jgi:predicted SnoaL-like aldol condensation-catalyzing enzyme
VQIAKSRGAYVIGTASAAKHDFLRSLGADEVIDYHSVDFAEVLSDIDVVLDPISLDPAARARSVAVLRPGGTLVSILPVPIDPAELAAIADRGIRYESLLVEADHAGMQAIADLVESGALRAHIEATFPLAEAAEAHALGETGRTTGKIVLTVRDSKAQLAQQLLQDLFERGDTAIVDRIVRPDYIQHNTLAPDGADGLKYFTAAMREQFPQAVLEPRRIITDGDLVLLHSRVVFVPGTAGLAVFDMFRFQDGKIAEHWDVIQEVPATTASGNDMFATLSEPRTEALGQRWFTAHHKKLVTAFVDQLLVRKDLTAIDTYVDTDYHEHNPNIADGAAGLKAELGFYFDKFPQLSVTPKRVIAEGDLVAVHSHYVDTPGERGRAVLDLFRVRDTKIVEHWNSEQDVPETAPNNNTMF